MPSISIHHLGYKNRTWSVPLTWVPKKKKFSVCLPLYIEFGNHHSFVSFISPNNVSLVLPIFVHFIPMESYCICLVTCFFILCYVFEIYPCWWTQLWFHQAHISTEFHYMDKSLVISPSSYWWVFELLVICYYEQCCCGQFLMLAYTHVQEFSSKVYILICVSLS